MPAKRLVQPGSKERKATPRDLADEAVLWAVEYCDTPPDDTPIPPSRMAELFLAEAREDKSKFLDRYVRPSTVRRDPDEKAGARFLDDDRRLHDQLTDISRRMSASLG